MMTLESYPPEPSIKEKVAVTLRMSGNDLVSDGHACGVGESEGVKGASPIFNIFSMS